MKRRYSKFVTLFLLIALAGPLSAQENKKNESLAERVGDTAEVPVKSDLSQKRNLIEVQLGPALSASGSIITATEGGIELLEQLINSNTLYAPRVSPIVQQIGPYYRVPPFSLGSNQIGASYERLFERFSFGGAFRFTDVSAGLKVPESFIPGALVGVPAPVISRVTAETNSRKLLASAFQLEGLATYHFNRDGQWDPFLRASVGVGRGWLAHLGYGPYLNEVHGAIGAGIRWNFNESSSLVAEVNTVGHWIVTGPSSFIDRTDVLINPGKGSIYIVRLLLGAGYRY